LFFPEESKNGKSFELFSRKKELVIEGYKQLIDPDNEKHAKRIKEINAYFKSQIKIKDYSKMEIEMDKSFEITCHLLSEHTNADVRRLSVKSYYALKESIDLKTNPKKQ